MEVNISKELALLISVCIIIHGVTANESRN
jgi:hypothetical protein